MLKAEFVNKKMYFYFEFEEISLNIYMLPMFLIFCFLIDVTYVSFDSLGIKRFNYVGRGEQMYLKRRKYQINIYGAQGGYGYGDAVRTSNGRRGMYIIAEFFITSETARLYYVLVGGAGVPNSEDARSVTGPNRGGFNGGGNGG